MVLSEQRDHRLPGPCVPGMPANPVLSKLAAAAGGQGSNSPVMNRFKSAAGLSSGTARPRGYEERAVGLSGGGAAAAAPESCVSICNANAAMWAPSMGVSIRGWREIRYTDRTAPVNSAAGSSNAAAGLPMFTHGSPIHRRETSNRQLLLNEKVVLSSDLVGDAQARSASCGTVAPPFSPVTPEKHKGAQDGGHPESVGSVDEGKTVIVGLDITSFLPTFVPKQKGPILPCFDNETSERGDFVSVGLPSQLQQNRTGEEAEKQGIDLNKTPQQKPGRKKHRPKVVQEGKPSRTPKLSTPNPATPKPAMNGENVSTKRKYVQRKGLNSQLETPSSAVARKNGELNERKRTSSTKQGLDFSAEDDKAADTFQCSTNTGSQEQGDSLQGNNSKYRTGNGNSDGKFTDMFINGQEVKVNFSVGIVPLLHPSNDHILGTCLNSLDIPSLHLQPSRKELIRENLKKLARIQDSQQLQSHDGITRSEVQTDCKLSPQGQCISTSASNLPSTDESVRRNEWKMDYNLFIDDTQLHNVNVAQADFNYEKACSYDKIFESSKCLSDKNNNPPYFPEIQKKRRTEKGHNELAFHEVTSFADAQRILELEGVRTMDGKQAFGRIEVRTMNSLKVPIQACNLASLNDNVKCDQLPIALQNLNLHDERHENGIVQGPQDCVKALSARTHSKVRIKRHRRKEQTQVVSVMSSNNRWH